MARLVTLAALLCGATADLAPCAGDDCPSWDEDELRQLSNSPEVLEAVSEDFGVEDERRLQAATGSYTSGAAVVDALSTIPSYVSLIPAGAAGPAATVPPQSWPHASSLTCPSSTAPR